MARWDEVMEVKTTDPLAFEFRAHMSRALLVCNQSDYDIERARRQKANLPENHAEIRKACRTTIRPPTYCAAMWIWS